MEDGDLLVMGSGVQRDWQHALPRRARAGERLGLGFRRLAGSG
jgi:alkylated DNA repair dioxygenase AlkB